LARKTSREPDVPKVWAEYLAAGAASLLVAGAAHFHVAQGVELLKSEYVDKARAEAGRRGADVDRAFAEIYQNLRTLASLPGIRAIDRHAETLTPEARATFQMIYNNLANSVSVSEVYVIPPDFSPDRLDPATGRTEEPIIMFDELILNAGAAISADTRAADPLAVTAAPRTGPKSRHSNIGSSHSSLHGFASTIPTTAASPVSRCRC
jgi:hypothetical protein